ncbi:DUF4932 domain-containing protein [Soonwooa purpurea]
MKKVNVYLGLTLMLIGNLANAQNKIEAYVDERVELMSSVFRMIDAEEYSEENNALYVEDLEKHFGSFKNSEFLKNLAKDRNNDGLGYDAVMSMAVNLKIKNGKISLIDPKRTSLDKRWKTEKLPDFIQSLNQYYKQTKFNDFYKSHQKDYQQAAKAFSDSVLVKLNQEWYPKFYGKQPNEDYKVVIGYGNGGGNYGPRVEGKKRDVVYAIVSGGKFDGRKLTYTSAYAPTLIHEFNHSFVNYILDTQNYKNELESAGEKILSAVKEPMSNQAYGNWETIINESIVRAAVIVYMKENAFSEADIKAEYKDQMKRRFLWIPELVALLEHYQLNRKQYPTLESFYPKIVEFFQNVGNNVQTIVADYEVKLPKVKSISPDINGKNDVDPSIKEIIVSFDKMMNASGMSINIGSLGREGVPISSRPVYINDNNAMKIEVSMKPNTEYEFIFVGNRFESVEGFPLQEYVVKFKTK